MPSARRTASPSASERPSFSPDPKLQSRADAQLLTRGQTPSYSRRGRTPSYGPRAQRPAAVLGSRCPATDLGARRPATVLRYRYARLERCASIDHVWPRVGFFRRVVCLEFVADHAPEKASCGPQRWIEGGPAFRTKRGGASSRDLDLNPKKRGWRGLEGAQTFLRNGVVEGRALLLGGQGRGEGRVCLVGGSRFRDRELGFDPARRGHPPHAVTLTVEPAAHVDHAGVAGRLEQRRGL